MKHKGKLFAGLALLLLLGLGLGIVWYVRNRPVPPCFIPQNPGLARTGDIPPPKGFERKPVPMGSFAAFLRDQPLKKDNTLFLYNEEPLANQCRHYGILDVDRGKKDLQQCADAVMRLRAEYLWQANRADEISFNFTSGHPARWVDWRSGMRCTVDGNNVTWAPKTAPNDSYASFKKYLELVFMYAGTASLEKELDRVQVEEMQIGDVFIFGGHPGHAMLVIDLVEHPKSGKKYFLLAEGSTPAQDLHVLKNTENARISPWFPVDFGPRLVVPGNTFYPEDLMRFRE